MSYHPQKILPAKQVAQKIIPMQYDNVYKLAVRSNLERDDTLFTN